MNKKTFKENIVPGIVGVIGVLVALGVGYLIMDQLVDSRVEIQEFCIDKEGFYNLSEHFKSSFYDECEINCSDKENLYCVVEVM